MPIFTPTPLKDLLIYEPKTIKDHRGFFMESYNQKHFLEAGLNIPFVQDNRSSSQYGTLRGLHLQTGSAAQAKLVTVISGHVFDVAVDLRTNSPTFKKWYGLHLKDTEPRSLFIPRGFAHGFLVLSKTAEFFYKVDNFYSPQHETGVIFDDEDLNIEWPIDKNHLILSDKDKALPSLSKAINSLAMDIV